MRFKTWHLPALLLVVGLAITIPVLAADKPAADKGAAQKADAVKAPAKSTSVVGELVDTACFAKEGARGADHAECATKCATSGIPTGVVDDKGNLYVLLTPAPALAQYMAKTVRVTGSSQAGGHAILVDSFEIKNGDTWSVVDITKH